MTAFQKEQLAHKKLLKYVIVVTLRNGSMGGRHSSVDSSAPTNLRFRVRIPNIPFTLLQFILYYIGHCIEKWTKINILDSTKLVNLYLIHHKKAAESKPVKQEVIHSCSDTFPYEVSECSLFISLHFHNCGEYVFLYIFLYIFEKFGKWFLKLCSSEVDSKHFLSINQTFDKIKSIIFSKVVLHHPFKCLD